VTKFNFAKETRDRDHRRRFVEKRHRPSIKDMLKARTKERVVLDAAVVLTRLLSRKGTP